MEKKTISKINVGIKILLYQNKVVSGQIYFLQ